MLNIYRASAGSGKTFQLTKDYIFLLFRALGENPQPHRRILAVTFTNKATDEMKSRILKELHALSTDEESKYRADLMSEFSLTENEVNTRAGKILVSILHDYSSFSISTIDKFFQQVVRSFAREIGINGGYNIELDTDLTLQQALDNLYSDLAKKENKQLLLWMSDFLQEQIEESKSWHVDKDIMKLGKEIFRENYQHKALEVREKLHNKAFLSEYRSKLRKIITDFKEKVISISDDTLNFLNSNGIRSEYFVRGMMFNTLENLKKEKFELGVIFRNFAESPENCCTKKALPEVKNAVNNIYHNGLKERLNSIIELIDNDIIQYNSARMILRHISILGIIADLTSEISKLTLEQNTMLLSDTNLLLNKIIDDSETPFVYERTGINIEHYMIDEFQDTSVLQWKNFKPLIANSLAYNKTNMLVGDVKQSIYRWRNSDWKLLDRKVTDEFSSSGINNMVLGTNWRSDRNIIHFNNSFFEKASALLQEKLNNNIGANPELDELKSIITHAYTDIRQEVSPKASEGYVKIEFVEQEKTKAEREKSVLGKIPALLEDLVDRGYKPNDIAFLVRYNTDATTLINYLLTYKKSPEARPGFSYNVVGSEGLMISSSPSVNFIIAVLKLILNPKDDVSRTIMHYEYQTGKLKIPASEALPVCFDASEDKNAALSALFTTEENECIGTISHLSLFEATENLINTFRIEDWHNETVFLQAFQDVVFKFVSGSNADLNTFLRWWDENSARQYIDTPENENAFRVMTVHKSKGLDFKVVIIPFCNWELDKTGKNSPLLWCETSVEPFSLLPLIPVKYSKDLKNTIFQNEYFDEQMHQYVDNLNLAYVAFTRARNEMYFFCDLPKPKNKGERPFSTISDLLYLSLDENTGTNKFLIEGSNIFESGEPGTFAYKAEKHESSIKSLTSYPVTESGERLKIRHTGITGQYSEQNPGSRLIYGNIMHEILQKTICRDDEQKAIAEQLAAGKIRADELPEIQKELERFWSLPEVNEWFSADNEILNETTILLPAGVKFRPDRVILNNGKATIIDYKFGDKEHPVHQRQVLQYASLLRQMGYMEIESCLYYVRLGKIIHC